MLVELLEEIQSWGKRLMLDAEVLDVLELGLAVRQSTCLKIILALASETLRNRDSSRSRSETTITIIR